MSEDTIGTITPPSPQSPVVRMSKYNPISSQKSTFPPSQDFSELSQLLPKPQPKSQSQRPASVDTRRERNPAVVTLPPTTSLNNSALRRALSRLPRVVASPSSLTHLGVHDLRVLHSFAISKTSESTHISSLAPNKVDLCQSVYQHYQHGAFAYEIQGLTDSLSDLPTIPYIVPSGQQSIGSSSTPTTAISSTPVTISVPPVPPPNIAFIAPIEDGDWCIVTDEQNEALLRTDNREAEESQSENLHGISQQHFYSRVIDPQEVEVTDKSRCLFATEASAWRICDNEILEKKLSFDDPYYNSNIQLEEYLNGRMSSIMNNRDIKKPSHAALIDTFENNDNNKDNMSTVQRPYSLPSKISEFEHAVSSNQQINAAILLESLQEKINQCQRHFIESSDTEKSFVTPIKAYSEMESDILQCIFTDTVQTQTSITGPMINDSPSTQLGFPEKSNLLKLSAAAAAEVSSPVPSRLLQMDPLFMPAKVMKLFRFDTPLIGLVLQSVPRNSGIGMKTIVKSKVNDRLNTELSSHIHIGDELGCISGTSMTGLSYHDQVHFIATAPRPLILGFF